jgi:hypothetical protein
MQTTLLERWTCDDNDANTTVVGDNGYNGTATANTSVLSTTGILDEAFNLAGSYYVELPNDIPSGIGGYASVALALWFKRSSIGTRQALLNLNYSSTSTKLLVEIQADNTIRAGGRSYSGDDFQAVETTDTYTDTSGWHFLVVVYDLPNNSIKIYVDCEEATITGSVSFGQSTFTADVGDPARLGSSVNGREWNGLLDEVRVYVSATLALTEGQIVRLCANDVGTTLSLGELYAENEDNRLLLPLV